MITVILDSFSNVDIFDMKLLRNDRENPSYYLGFFIRLL